MIIQRWQTLLIFIAAVMMALFSFLSLGQIQTFNASYDITALGIQNISKAGDPVNQYTIYIFVISLLSVLLSIISIYSYKNLRLQIRLCLINCMLIMASCLSEFLVCYNLCENLNGSLSWSSIIAAPFIALIALLCAWNCIKSDKRKLASLDRLR